MSSPFACTTDEQVFERPIAVAVGVFHQRRILLSSEATSDRVPEIPEVAVVPDVGTSELFRILTLTLRLWGNIWGGEIVLSVLAALLFIPSLSLPFIGLELFIGFIQAFVFAFLVLLYIILALESHGGEEHEAHEPEAHNEALPMAA